jgi:hypothetical protein
MLHVHGPSCHGTDHDLHHTKPTNVRTMIHSLVIMTSPRDPAARCCDIAADSGISGSNTAHRTRHTTEDAVREPRLGSDDL